MANKKEDIATIHRYLDEAGDTTFFGKGKVNIVGENGVSKSFILGLVKFKVPLTEVRNKIRALQQQVCTDPYFMEVPSIQNKINKGGYYFHATDDLPEVRKLFYDYIKTISCSFEAVVGRKIMGIYTHKHNGKEAEFYADLLSHLIKNKLNKGGKLILDIASRGNSTKNQNLQTALQKAISRNSKKGKPAATKVVFNVQNHHTEPLLNVSDYFCWSIQRLFERGETRYYNFLKDQVSLVVDLYDDANYLDSGNYYTVNKPLTKANMLK
ncbi:MAG: DUF3800 domain-containing protein [Lewinella sp.]|nr:DUF3800 domain-containing protein [Lewinella sp.]